jgi:hypothetical protein
MLPTISSASCSVVAYVATEPETVFSDHSFTRILMFAMQAKLPVLGAISKGKCRQMRTYWGPRIRSFAKSPQKGSNQMVAALERHWTSVDSKP